MKEDLTKLSDEKLQSELNMWERIKQVMVNHSESITTYEWNYHAQQVANIENEIKARKKNEQNP